MPEEIGKILLRGFQLGLPGQAMTGWGKVVKYFNENSLIIPWDRGDVGSETTYK